MATPREKLAESPEKLRMLQADGIVGIKASDLSRVHLERPVVHGFIIEVLKGWYIATPHEEQTGERDQKNTGYQLALERTDHIAGHHHPFILETNHWVCGIRPTNGKHIKSNGSKRIIWN